MKANIQQLLAGLAFAMLALSSCSTAQIQTAESDLTALAPTVESLVNDFYSDGQVNYAQVIPTALNSLAVFDPSTTVDLDQLSTSISGAINAFTNGTAKTTGQKIANAIVAALPANPTGAQVNAALTRAGIGASSGSNP